MNNKSKYIYDRFEDSKEYKQELVELIRNLTNIEVGGNRFWDGQRMHLMQSPWELTDFIFALGKSAIVILMSGFFIVSKNS